MLLVAFCASSWLRRHNRLQRPVEEHGHVVQPGLLSRDSVGTGRDYAISDFTCIWGGLGACTGLVHGGRYYFDRGP